MDQDLVFKVADLLRTVFSGDKTELIKAAEAQLELISQNTESYFEVLLGILLNSDNQLRNASAVNLNNFIAAKVKSKQIKSNRLNYFTESILQVMNSEGMNQRQINIVGDALKDLISLDIKKNQGTNTLQLVAQAFPGVNQNLNNFCASCKVLQCTFEIFAESNVMERLFAQTFGAVVNTGKQLLEELTSEAPIKLLEIFKCLSAMIQYFQEPASKVLSQLKNETRFAELLLGVLVGDPKLIEVKTKATEQINMILKHSQLEESPFLSALLSAVEPLSLSLESLISNFDLDTILQNEEYSLYICEVLRLLSKLVKKTKFGEFFSQNSFSLVSNVCMPLLKTSSYEMFMLQELPEDSIEELFDVCLKRESKTVKSYSSLLLQRICDYFKGTLEFVVETCCGFLKGSFPDIGFVCLSIVSHKIQKPELVFMVKQTVKENIQTWVSSNFAVQTKFAFFLLNFKNFFDLENQTLEVLVGFCKTQVPPVAILASSALCELCFSSEFNYFYQLIQVLINIVPLQNSKEFFENLQKVINQNIDKILPYLNSLVEQLCLKVGSESNSVVRKRCWSILNSVAKSSCLTKENVVELETKVHGLLEKHLLSLGFQSTAVKKCGGLSETGWKFFNDLRQNPKMEKFSCVKLFNYWLYYGRERFTQKILFEVTESCFRFLFASKDKVAKARCALLVEQILQTFALEGCLESILWHTLQLLDEENKLLRSRLLGIVLNALKCNLEETLEYLFRNNSVDLLFSRIFESNFAYALDKKTAVIGLSGILKTQNAPCDLRNILSFLIGILSSQENCTEDLELETNFSNKVILKSYKFNYLKSLVIPVLSADEFQCLKETMNWLRQNSSERFNYLVGGLSNTQKNQLLEIVSYKRVRVSEEVYQARKVVKPKFN